MYLKFLQRLAFRHKFGWDFVQKPADPTSYPEEGINQVLKTLDYGEMPQRIRQVGTDVKLAIEAMAADLHDDLFDCVPEEHHGLLTRSRIGFIPTGVVNAFCTGRDDLGNQLDGNIIALNYGLLFSCEKLAEALIYENLTGDLTAYRHSGKQSFKSAVLSYLDPTIPWYGDRNSLAERRFPPAVRGEIAAYTGANIAIMLTFIALHEFGHIVNGDLDSEIGVRRFNWHTLTPEYNRHQPQTDQYQQFEYRADAFALSALCRRSKSKETAWINLASIHLLFLFFNHIETEMGRPLCPRHPPPLKRSGQLRKQLHHAVGPPDQDYFKLVDNLVSDWR